MAHDNKLWSQSDTIARASLALPSAIGIRAATAADCPRLAEIALAAKGHWGYPAEWLDSWRGHLVITPKHLSEWEVFCAQRDPPESGQDPIVGMAALSYAPLGEDAPTAERAGLTEAEIEGLWVWPAQIGRGVGRVLMTRLLARARDNGAAWLRIESDPHATGFYERWGARRVGSVAATPEGRWLPLYYLDLRA